MNEPALKTAIGLLHLPANVRRLRGEPVPEDIEHLLRILAGDEGAEQDAAILCDRPRTIVREAATFYAEQILLHRDADHYRVLGAAPHATTAELRRNMALLLLWLHPDRNCSEGRSVLAARVTGAWENLRTADRRAAYDASTQSPCPGVKGAEGVRRYQSARGPQSSGLLRAIVVEQLKRLLRPRVNS